MMVNISRRDLIISTVLFLIAAGVTVFSIADDPEAHEVWDCTDHVCERANITETQTCENDDGQYSYDACRTTTQGIEEVTMFTDQSNFIRDPLTDEEYHVDILSGEIAGWDLSYIDDERFFVTRRSGELRLFENEDLIESATLDKTSRMGNAGLLGVAPHPDFDENSYVYLYYSNDTAGDETEDDFYNIVSRFKFEEGELRDEKVLIDRIDGNRGHSGGRLMWGPDDHIYVTTGDGELVKNGGPEKYERVQELDYLGGRTLRVTPEGEIPGDNPFDDSYVYSLGHRNVQGLAFHPDTEDMFISEHGPWRHDEVNHIEPGRNYGWPGKRCSQDYKDIEIDDETVDPVKCFDEWTLAPSGITFVDQEGHQWENDLFVSGLKGNQVYRIELNDEMRVENSELFFFNKYSEEMSGRVRDVEFRNGSLYLLGDGWGSVRVTPS